MRYEQGVELRVLDDVITGMRFSAIGPAKYFLRVLEVMEYLDLCQY